MADIAKLKAELLTDELVRGYAAMSDAEAAVSLNVVNRKRNKTSLTGSQVLNAIDKDEFNAKTPDQKQEVWNIVHLGEVNPFGIEADILTDIFEIGSNTILALQELRREDVSRAVEEGIGWTGEGDVEDARL